MTAIGFALALIGFLIGATGDAARSMFIENMGAFILFVGLISFVSGITVFLWRVMP